MTMLRLLAIGLAAAAALAAGPAPRPPFRPSAIGSQPCPAPADFVLATPRPVTLPAAPVDVWSVVRAALTRWRDSTFGADYDVGSAEATPAYVMMEASPAGQIQQASVDLAAGHTCFFEGRSKKRRNTDFRIAFWFGIRGTPGQKAGRVLELRWVSGIKGSGERTWQPDVLESARQAEALASGIEARLR